MRHLGAIDPVFNPKQIIFEKLVVEAMESDDLHIIEEGIDNVKYWLEIEN